MWPPLRQHRLGWTPRPDQVARPPSAARGGELPPLLDQGVGAPFFAWTKNRLRLPQPFTDRVGTVQLSGRRLDALPHALRRGPLPRNLVRPCLDISLSCIEFTETGKRHL